MLALGDIRLEDGDGGKGPCFRRGVPHGERDFYPKERPIHEVVVGDLWVDEYPVTNAQFRRFVKATCHVTVAERVPTRRIFLVRQPLIWCPGL
jgi:formylglycine-generating enzyme